VSEQENPQADLETRILDKVLVRLYLSSTALPDRARVEELSRTGHDLGSETRSRLIKELTILYLDFRGEGRARIEEQFTAVLGEEEAELPATKRQRLLESIIAEILGYGPLEPILADETVDRIMVDGPDYIYVERRGRLEDVPYRFRDDAHLIDVINRIVGPLGRKVDASAPSVNARLADGTRVNAVVPPISLIGPVLTLLKSRAKPLSAEDLVRFGTLNEGIAEFLRACVRARLNILVAGGSASGKTTVLNLIAGMIPDDERIVTVENVGELRLPQKYVVPLESRPANWEGKGEISVRDLVRNALRMRPDRIVVGEVRSAEVLDLVAAMSSGHEGSMATVHAGSPGDALARLEVMMNFGDLSLPPLNVRQMVASAIDLVTYQERLRDGSRKLLKVTEVAGMQGDVILTRDIFQFRETGAQEAGVTGYHTATGYIPRFLDRVAAAGTELPLSMFTPR
jgi:pilus assembly protein CpaF